MASKAPLLNMTRSVCSRIVLMIPKYGPIRLAGRSLPSWAASWKAQDGCPLQPSLTETKLTSDDFHATSSAEVVAQFSDDKRMPAQGSFVEKVDGVNHACKGVEAAKLGLQSKRFN